MSGEPPPGIRHLLTGRRVRKEIRVIEPSPRLETNRYFESRLGYRPWAPLPVGSKRIRRSVCASISQTPLEAMSAT